MAPSFRGRGSSSLFSEYYLFIIYPDNNLIPKFYCYLRFNYVTSVSICITFSQIILGRGGAPEEVNTLWESEGQKQRKLWSHAYPEGWGNAQTITWERTRQDKERRWSALVKMCNKLLILLTKLPVFFFVTVKKNIYGDTWEEWFPFEWMKKKCSSVSDMYYDLCESVNSTKLLQNFNYLSVWLWLSLDNF